MSFKQPIPQQIKNDYQITRKKTFKNDMIISEFKLNSRKEISNTKSSLLQKNVIDKDKQPKRTVSTQLSCKLRVQNYDLIPDQD